MSFLNRVFAQADCEEGFAGFSSSEQAAVGGAGPVGAGGPPGDGVTCENRVGLEVDVRDGFDGPATGISNADGRPPCFPEGHFTN